MTNSSYLDMVVHFVKNQQHSGVDFREPFVRPSLRYVYPFFIFLHTAVAVVGIAGNTSMVIVIVRRGLYQDKTFFMMINLAFSDLIKCVVVLPISLANLLIQNWQFGSFLCFFLPMLQCFPVHASMLTFLMIAIDRYRMIVHPFKSRLPAGLCIIGVWVTSVCVVLPYAIYIKYIDLESTLGTEFEGLGICYIFVGRSIEEYIRAMFVTMYAMPLAVISLLYVRISAEFKSREYASVSLRYAHSTLTHDLEQDVSTRSTSTLSWSPLPQMHAFNTASSGIGTLATSNSISSNATRQQGRNSLSAATVSSSQTSPGRRSPSATSTSRGGVRGEGRGEGRGEVRGEGKGEGKGGEGKGGEGRGGGGESRDVGGERGSSGGDCGISNVHHHHQHHHRHHHHHHNNPSPNPSSHHAGYQSTSLLPRNSQAGSDSFSTGSHNLYKSYNDRPSNDSDDEMDLAKEKRTQYYLITMTTQFAMCWCPFQILVLVNYFVHEKDTNTGHYDITYIIFAWFGFLSTCLTPILFASWRMSAEAKDKLKGYFRFSNRRRASSSAQRRRYPSRYANESQSGLFEEHMVLESRSADRNNSTGPDLV